MSAFWDDLVRHIGRNTLFVDTCAILNYFAEDDLFRLFFQSAPGYRYVTSTYVITEVARRLVKTKTPNAFIGPGREYCKELSLHILEKWLDEWNVYLIHLPEEEFNVAVSTYSEKSFVDCDLTDVISYTIVTGMGKDEILSGDAHFSKLSLRLLP